MDTFLLILFGLGGTLLGSYYFVKALKTPNISYIIFIIIGVCLYVVSMTFTGMTIERKYPLPVNSSKFDVKIEIHKQIIDEKVISIDTVYIFKPK